MKVVDANVLLYAVNRDAPHHQSARKWLYGALSGDEAVGFAWTVLLAFLRLTTRQGIFPKPLTLAVEHAGEIVSFDGDLGRFPGLRWRMPLAH